MSTKIKLPSIKEVECILKQIQGDYLKVIGDFTPITIIHAGVRKPKLSGSDISSLINHRHKVNNIYSELFKLKVNKNFLSRETYELDLKILSNMSVFLTEIIERKSVSRTHFGKYQSIRNILSSNGSVFLNLISLASISLYEKKGVEESFKWLDKKTKRDKKQTKSYLKFINTLRNIEQKKEMNIKILKEDSFENYRKYIKKLETQISIFQENYGGLELVDIS